MRYAVLGAGGLGGLIGGALARAGHTVTLVVRPESAKQHPRSLSVNSRVLGDFEVAVKVANEVGTVDVVWITVKATQLDESLSAMPVESTDDGLIIPLLNGVDHVSKLRALYRPTSVVAGTIRVESERTAPGIIRQLSPFAVIQLAAAGPSQSRAQQVADEVCGTGLSCEMVKDEPSMLWSKLAFLAPLALTTTAKRATLGEVRDDPTWHNRLEHCVVETCRAAHVSGAKIDVAKTLKLLDGFPDGLKSSMQKDVEAGRTPELDAIAGPIVRRGQTHGFDVSATQELIEMIEAKVIS